METIITNHYDSWKIYGLWIILIHDNCNDPSDLLDNPLVEPGLFAASNCSLKNLGFSQDGTGKSVPWQWKSLLQLMISYHPLWSIFMYFSR